MSDSRPQRRSRFGEVAANYAHSRLFAAGEDLRWLVDAAGLQGTEMVVDVGTGAGHLALAFAPRSREVVGVDPEPAMLDQARALAARRSLENVRFLPGSAAAVPLPDHIADLVVTRFATHHFPALDEAVAEFRRVAKSGGSLLVVDTVSPVDPEADDFLHRVETLRDPSHVRDWSLAEWQSSAGRYGFTLRVLRAWDLHLDFQDWVTRQRTPNQQVAELQQLMLAAPTSLRELFAIAGDPVNTFCLKCCLLEGTAV